MINGTKTPKGTLEQRPLWTPLALFLGAQGFFVWKVINLANSPDWVKKVTAFSRWLFFGTDELGDCGMDLRGVHVLFYRLFYLLFYIENIFIKAVF